MASVGRVAGCSRARLVFCQVATGGQGSWPKACAGGDGEVPSFWVASSPNGIHTSAGRLSLAFCGWKPASWPASHKTWATALCRRLRCVIAEGLGHTGGIVNLVREKKDAKTVLWSRSEKFWVPVEGGSGSSYGPGPRLALGEVKFVKRHTPVTSRLSSAVSVTEVGHEFVVEDRSFWMPGSVTVNGGLETVCQRPPVPAPLLEVRKAASEWETGAL